MSEKLRQRYDCAYASGYGKRPKRNDLIIDWISGLPGPLHILDVGAGKGFLASELEEKGHRVICTDISDKAVAECRSRGLHAFRMDSERLPMFHENTFDLVICSDVLEHLEGVGEMINVLHSMSYITRKRMVISVGVGSSKHKGVELHEIQESPEWWSRRVSSFMLIEERSSVGISHIFCGSRKYYTE